MIRYVMIVWFILSCLRQGINPWRFFQLNAGYFNKKKGIYSKFDLNLLVPEQWRLKQTLLDTDHAPSEFPVFLKPEWGQNAYGIFRADSVDHLYRIQKAIPFKTLPYLLQAGAKESREFEIFYIRQANDLARYAIISITEVINTEETAYPINGVFNRRTFYQDRSTEFSNDALDKIWQHLRTIGQFRMARVGLKTSSKWDLISGRFHIIEINLFTPMPLNLLDRDNTWISKTRFINKYIKCLTASVKETPNRNDRENIFVKKTMMHFKVKSIRPEFPIQSSLPDENRRDCYPKNKHLFGRSGNDSAESGTETSSN